MPNRLIKESICTSDNLNSLSKDAEILFYRLIVNCDDYGLLDARLPIILSKCFPLKVKSIDEKNIQDWLQELADANLIFLYQVDGKPYLKMTKWEKHQQVRNQKSKYPKPDINCNQMISNDINCTRNPIQSESNPNPNPNPNMCAYDENAYDESTAALDNTPAEIPEEGGAQDPDDTGKGEYTAEFEEFWQHYPRKLEKKTAYGAWKARLKGGAKAIDMINACINYARYCEMQNAEQQFIKHASTFIGSNRPYEEFIKGVPEINSIQKPRQFKTPVTTFNSYDQRDYTPDKIKEIENSLLGRDGPMEDTGG